MSHEDLGILIPLGFIYLKFNLKIYIIKQTTLT